MYAAQLPRRVPGAALRAAGYRPAEAPPDWQALNRSAGAPRVRGWFEAVTNPAIGKARVPLQRKV